LKSAEDTLDTCKSIIKETEKLQILRAHFIELQREMCQICCLKIPVPTRWGSILHFWTVLKSKNVLKRLVIKEETTLGKCLRSYVLDDDIVLDVRANTPRADMPNCQLEFSH